MKSRKLTKLEIFLILIICYLVILISNLTSKIPEAKTIDTTEKDSYSVINTYGIGGTSEEADKNIQKIN